MSERYLKVLLAGLVLILLILMSFVLIFLVSILFYDHLCFVDLKVENVEEYNLSPVSSHKFNIRWCKNCISSFNSFALIGRLTIHSCEHITIILDRV